MAVSNAALLAQVKVWQDKAARASNAWAAHAYEECANELIRLIGSTAVDAIEADGFPGFRRATGT